MNKFSRFETLQHVLNILEEMPKKELVHGEYETAGCRCVIGEVVQSFGELPEFLQLVDKTCSFYSTTAIEQVLKFTSRYEEKSEMSIAKFDPETLEELQEINDYNEHASLELRYRVVLEYVKRGIESLRSVNVVP